VFGHSSQVCCGRRRPGREASLSLEFVTGPPGPRNELVARNRGPSRKGPGSGPGRGLGVDDQKMFPPAP